ncbi:MAG: class II glutamine amidotransferase [Halofilum sp. (in: g-proteobacteria)]
MVAYLGAPIRLDRFLLEPPHGLVEQAHAPRETLSATVNADGFGVGWYDDAGTPAAYRTLLPAWADPNLPPLGRSLTRAVWLANVRSATDPLSNGYANTQPFHDERLLFLHNGFVSNFGVDLRARLRAWFRPEIEAGIQGTTDSEYVFAALRQAVADQPRRPLADHLLWLVQDVLGDNGGEEALLNFIVCDGTRMVALRHAVGAGCPTLYLRTRDAQWDGHALASEPLTDETHWEAIPPHYLIECGFDTEPTIRPL